MNEKDYTKLINVVNLKMAKQILDQVVLDGQEMCIDKIHMHLDNLIRFASKIAEEVEASK